MTRVVVALTMKKRSAAVAICARQARRARPRSRSRLRSAISSRLLALELVEQVVGLDADPLAARHLERLALALLVAGRRRAGARSPARAPPSRRRSGPSARASSAWPSACEAGAHDLLQVALAGVDDVDHPLGAAEGRVLVGAARGVGLPDPLLLPEAVAEVAAEQAELPELVGDVLADVGDGAVGAHDHLVGVLEAGELRRCRRAASPSSRRSCPRSRAAPRRSP